MNGERSADAVYWPAWRSWAIGIAFCMFAFNNGCGGGCGGGGCDTGCDSGCESGCDSGCGEAGCDTETYPEGAPAVDRGVQVRLSAHALTFIEQNLTGVIDQFLDTGLTFCIPEGSGPDLCNVRTCPSTGETGCELSAEIIGVEVDAVEESSISATVTVGGLFQEEDFIEVTLLSDCVVRLGTVNDEGLDASIVASFVTDPLNGNLTVDIDPESISINFDQLAYDIDGQEFLDTFLCETLDFASDLGFVRDLIFGFATGQIDSAVSSLDGILCQSCENAEVCPEGSSCNETDTGTFCINDSTEECVAAPLGFEGVIDLGGLLASVTPGLEADLAVQLKAFGYAESINDGLTVAAKGGTYADKSECVPMIPPPAVDRVPISMTLQGNERPDGEPFQLGIGVSKPFVDEALWGAFNSGALCLAVGSDLSDFISTSTFSLLLQSLGPLTGGKNSPMLLQIQPAEPPTATFGAGILDPESGALVEPLITLNWNNVTIDVHAFFNERFVRLFSYNIDLALPLALEVTDAGLVPVLGDIANGITRVEARNAGILKEDPDTLASLLPSLIGVALPLLGDSLSNPIEIPEIEGFVLALDQGSLTAIDGGSMLGVFANLELAGTMNAEPLMLDTEARLVDVALPPDELIHHDPRVMTAKERIDALMASRPVVTIEASAHLLTQELYEGEAEYSYRLNNGMWSTFRTDPAIQIDDPILLLQGLHRIEIRARRPGAWTTLDRTPAVIELPIDFEAPRLSLRVDGDLLRFDATDSVTEDTALQFSFRVNDDPSWSPWAFTTQLDLNALRQGLGDHVRRIEVRVRDRAGLTATDVREFDTRAQPIHGTVERSEDGGCDCAQVSPRPTQGGGGLPLSAALLALCGGLVWARRRRSSDAPTRPTRKLPAVIAALLGLTLVAAGCSEDSSGTSLGQTDLCAEVTCGDGETCVEGECQMSDNSNNTTGDPCAACGDNQVCVNQACVDHGCNEGDCPGGEACVAGDDGVRQCSPIVCAGPEDCGYLADECGVRGTACNEGACACAEFCPGGCGDGSFCCEQSNMCQALPDPCAGVECPVGERVELMSEASADAATCDVQEGQCGCVELDPLPVGQVGRYSDSVLVGDTLVVSAYNDRYGDLVVGVVQEDDTIDWEFIDGLPEEGPVTGSLNGPRAGVATPGPNVGQFSSIDADSAGNLHVAYRDVNNGSLKYALGVAAEGGGWTWTTYTADEDGDTGYWTDITVSPSDIPAIAYMTRVSDGPDPGRPVGLSKLRWLEASEPIPATAELWTATDLDTQEIAFYCGGECPRGTECRIDTNTCEEPSDEAECNDSCNGDQECFAGTCANLPPDPGLEALPIGVGLFAKAARFADGTPAVAYYDSVGNDLRFVQGGQDGWEAPVILAGRDMEGNDVTDAGQFCSLFIDDSDTVHIAYVDAITDDLRYIRLGDSATDELVDDGIRIDGAGLVSLGLIGEDSAIVVDGEGKVRIAYQDTSRHDLILARRNGPGQWDLINLAGAEEQYTGAYGFYTRQLWNGTQSVITTFRYNRNVEPEQNDVAIRRF